MTMGALAAEGLDPGPDGAVVHLLAPSVGLAKDAVCILASLRGLRQALLVDPGIGPPRTPDPLQNRAVVGKPLGRGADVGVIEEPAPGIDRAGEDDRDPFPLLPSQCAAEMDSFAGAA